VFKNTHILGTLIENNMIISYQKLAEEGQMKCHERYCNMFELRMKMDEKHLKFEPPCNEYAKDDHC
jgi:hypothetical protein